MKKQGGVRQPACRLPMALSVVLVLGACGGGGSDAPSGSASEPSVSSSTAGTPKYSQALKLTLTGTNLDHGLAVSATGCDSAARDIAASSATTAIYQCTVTATGTGQWVVARTSDSATLATVPFTVPVPQVTLTVSNGAAVGGTLVVTLSPDKTPVTVNNFLAYVNAGFYNGTVFHRVSPGFVVQAGGYSTPLDATSQVLKTTSAPIPLEVGKGLSNRQWTIAMARASDPASATSQFFINLVDNSASLDPGLSAGYAVFGSVSSGMGNVAGIAGAPCVALPLFLPSGECTPTPNVVISSAIQTQ